MEKLGIACFSPVEKPKLKLLQENHCQHRMLCNENCRMGDPANRLILSIVVSGVPRNQKGMLPGRRFTHTRAAGAQRPPDRGRNAYAQ
jgi:hypothetical protein